MTDTSKVRYVFPLNVPWQQCSQTAPVMHYSSGGDHFGWDVIPTNGGSPKVLAACGGEVVEVQHLTTSYGQHVWILGDDGLYYVYAHMQVGSICVSEGQRVEAGNVLGTMGGTGNVTGPHLHLGIQKTLHGFTGDINPATFLGFKDAVAPITQLGSGNAQNSTGTDATSSTSAPYSEVDSWEDIDILETIKDSYEKGEYLYGRKWRILVSDSDGIAVDVSAMHCVFSIQKTYMKDIQFSTLDIYNVSKNTENLFINTAYQVTIEAGYEGTYYGQIYTGDVVQVYGYIENGTDFVLRIVSADNERFMDESFVNFSWMRGMTQRDQAENVVSMATVKSDLTYISNDTYNISLPRGKVFFGMAKDYISQIAKNVGASFYNEDGTVKIVKAEDLTEGRIFDLNPSSGLISTPQQTDTGIEGKCLLIPQIGINSAIHIENKYIKQKQLTWGSSASVSTIGNATGDSVSNGSTTTVTGATGTFSNGLIEFVKAWEELHLVAYYDEGAYTIGYGHQDGTIKPGQTCTEEQANQWLLEDLTNSANRVDNPALVPFTSQLTAYQREVLISFDMNMVSRCLPQLCQSPRTPADIPEHIMSYVNGQESGYMGGLAKRRQCEKDVWTSGSCVYEGTTYNFMGASGASAANVSNSDSGSSSGGSSSTSNSINPLDESQIYRVVKLKYSGDTRGDNWYIEFEAYRQTGQVPALLSEV